MWGVLIFLRFFFVVGHAGVWQSLLIVFVFMSSFHDHEPVCHGDERTGRAGGAYFIISRALGHKLGGAVGCRLFRPVPDGRPRGARRNRGDALVEPELAAGVGVEGAVRLWAVVLLIALALMVWGGMKLVSQLGLFFAAVVGLTLTSYYAGLIARATARNFVGRDRIVVSNVERQLGSGLHRRRHFLHCAVRLLSVLHRDLGWREQGERSEGSHRSIPLGTLAAITLSLCMYASYMIMAGRGRG